MLGEKYQGGNVSRENVGVKMLGGKCWVKNARGMFAGKMSQGKML